MNSFPIFRSVKGDSAGKEELIDINTLSVYGMESTESV